MDTSARTVEGREHIAGKVEMRKAKKEKHEKGFHNVTNRKIGSSSVTLSSVINLDEVHGDCCAQTSEKKRWWKILTRRRTD